MKYVSLCMLVTALAFSACHAAPQPVADDNAQKLTAQHEMKALIGKRLDEWLVASRELQAHAPTPSDRGWSTIDDAAAIQAMRADWHKARTAYELIEGAVAPLFPESDAATDSRYDDYLATIGSDGDKNAFDDRGIVGMHAIERILWADQIPKDVIAFESGVPGYKPAAYPANAAQARDFKDKLATRLVHDIEKLRSEFGTIDIDLAFAFRGLVDLAAEQAEKVDRASTGQEESRYAQTTLKDLRANRQGCLEAYRVFQPWLRTRPDGAALDARVLAAFQRLDTAYTAISGEAIPRPPEMFSRIEPTAAQLATPFGQLFSVVKHESDEKTPGSLRAGLGLVADKLDLPKIAAQ